MSPLLAVKAQNVPFKYSINDIVPSSVNFLLNLSKLRIIEIISPELHKLSRLLILLYPSNQFHLASSSIDFSLCLILLFTFTIVF